MTDAERENLRSLQDRWLNHPLVRRHVARHGESESIAHVGSPSFREVRQRVLPEWADWFRDFLEG